MKTLIKTERYYFHALFLLIISRNNLKSVILHNDFILKSVFLQHGFILKSVILQHDFILKSVI